MIIKTFTFNPVMVNTYVLHDETSEAIVIDAGCFNQREKSILHDYLVSNKLTVKRLINTHLHFDHQFGNRYMFETYGVMPEAHQSDEFLLERVKAKAIIFGFPISEDAQALGSYLNEGDKVTAGNMALRCIHVPGHSPGHLAFYNENQDVLFCGDILFQGSIGRTDLEQGDHELLISGIQQKLLILPANTKVYPGHGPSTNIGYEKNHNPYL